MPRTKTQLTPAQKAVLEEVRRARRELDEQDYRTQIEVQELIAKRNETAERNLRQAIREAADRKIPLTYIKAASGIRHHDTFKTRYLSGWEPPIDHLSGNWYGIEVTGGEWLKIHFDFDTPPWLARVEAGQIIWHEDSLAWNAEHPEFAEWGLRSGNDWSELEAAIREVDTNRASD